MSKSTGTCRPIWKQLLMTGCLTMAIASLQARAEDSKPADKPADAPPTRPQAGRLDPSQIFKMQRERLDQLNLTDDQKKKLDEIYTNAEAELKKADDGDRSAFAKAMKDVREKTREVLTDEQKSNLPAARATGGPIMNVIDRLETSLGKLDLSAEQKAKVEPVLADAKKKFAELRSQLQSGDRTAMREKFKTAMDETRDKLKEILTPQQAAKLKADLDAVRTGAAAGRPGAAPAETPAKPADK